MPQEQVDVSGMFNQFSNTRTTVWFYDMPKHHGVAKWARCNVYANLADAAKAVIDDEGKHFSYELVVHDYDADRRLSISELAALVAELGGPLPSPL